MSTRLHSGSSSIERRQKQRERAEQIRKTALEYLDGNGFGASTSKMIKHIRPGLNFSPTKCQIGQILARDPKFVKVGRASGSTGGGTWILKKELEEEVDET